MTVTGYTQAEMDLLLGGVGTPFFVYGSGGSSGTWKLGSATGPTITSIPSYLSNRPMIVMSSDGTAPSFGRSGDVALANPS